MTSKSYTIEVRDNATGEIVLASACLDMVAVAAERRIITEDGETIFAPVQFAAWRDPANAFAGLERVRSTIELATFKAIAAGQGGAR